MNMIVNWFEVMGQNPAKLQSFYSQVFDWELSPTPGMPDYVTLAASEGGIGGGIGKSMDGGPGRVLVYVEVDDVQAALDRAVAAGGTVITPPTALPMVTFAHIQDPEGHVIGLGKGNEAS